MFVRVTHATIGGKTYNNIKVVRNYRDKGKVRQQTIASLGSIERFSETDIDNIINGLCRIFGRELPETPSQFEEAPSYGEIHAIIHLWRELKIAQVIERASRGSRIKFDLAEHIKLMVANRLCDPKSKLALLAWLEGVYVPGIDRSRVKYQNLLRAMDWLIENKARVEAEIAQEVITMFDREVDLVFYDMTSSYFETELTDDLRKYGFSRDHRGDRPQVMIGMVMTREGVPICHHVFPGNTLDKTTLVEVVRDLKARFPITRAVLVGDRGMLSRENIDALREEGLDYIVAVNMRQDADADELMFDFQFEVEEARPKWREAEKRYRESGDLPDGVGSEDELYDGERIFGEAVVNGRRLVVEHSEEVARVSAEQRRNRLGRTDEGVKLVIGKLEEQDRGKRRRGRQLTEAGALIQLNEIVQKNRLGREYKLDIEDGYVTVVFDELSLGWEEVLDGKLVVETSLEDMKPEEVIRQYRDLRQIEDAFRTLKSTLEIRPMHHWTPDRIKAHVFICVIALVIERVMRHRLRSKGERMQPGRVLEKLRAVRAIVARTSKGIVRGLTAVSADQQDLFTKLGVPVPVLKDVLGG